MDAESLRRSVEAEVCSICVVSVPCGLIPLKAQSDPRIFPSRVALSLLFVFWFCFARLLLFMTCDGFAACNNNVVIMLMCIYFFEVKDFKHRC